MQVYVFSVLLLFCAAGAAQDLDARIESLRFPDGNIRRDSAGLALLTQSLATMGGDATVGQLHSVRSVGTISNSKMDGPAVSVTWNYVLHKRFPVFRKDFIAINRVSTVASNGSRVSISDLKSQKPNSHVAYSHPPLHIPAVVFWDVLHDSQYEVQFRGTELFNGRSCQHVHIALEENAVTQAATSQDWFLDEQTLLPIGVQYRLTANSRASVYLPAVAYLGEYKLINSILIPFQIEFQSKAGVRKTTWSEIEFNQDFSGDNFGTEASRQ